MRCDSCASLYVTYGAAQAVFIHESGCPNSGKIWDSEERAWRKVYRCIECASEYSDVEDALACCVDYYCPDEDETERMFSDEA